MLLLGSEALSALSHGPAVRWDRVRALIFEMRRKQFPVATVAAVLAELAEQPRDLGFGQAARLGVAVALGAGGVAFVLGAGASGAGLVAVLLPPAPHYGPHGAS